jgi:hypothetical protein
MVGKKGGKRGELEEVRRIDSRQGPGYWEELIERADGSRYAICSYEANVVSFFACQSLEGRWQGSRLSYGEVFGSGLDRIVLPGGERIPIYAWATIK